MQIPVLYEDTHLLVINKPPGVVVNRAQSVHVPTVQDWVEEYLHIDSSNVSATGPSVDHEHKSIEDVFADRSGMAHRIDKETSGCLLIAKTPQVLDALLTKFRLHEMKKTYLAFTHGRLVPPQGEIKAPVGRLPWNSERFGILAGGKDSVTEYQVVRTFQRPSTIKGNKGATDVFSLVACFPKTGRTHQIRVHLKYINHPIVGDYLYAGRKTSRDDRVWAPRVMLHAWKLEFIHPVGGNLVAIEAPIPDDMKRIIEI